MQIRQISIFLENKPGQLSRICRDLADAGIDIAALSLADTSDFGIVRMIVNDYEKATRTLSEKGCVVNVAGVVAMGTSDTSIVTVSKIEISLFLIFSSETELIL